MIKTFGRSEKRRAYEKKPIENVMAGSSVFMSWNRSSGSDPADFADNSILAGGIFLFCKRIGKISQVVYGDKLYKNHLDSFVKERAMTLKTKLCILLPASAMLMCAFFMMSNLPGRIFILLLILFKYVYFFTKIKTIRIEAA